MKKTEHRAGISVQGPGRMALILILSFLVLGEGMFGILVQVGQSWALDAMAGFGLAGILGVIGFWTYRMALCGSDSKKTLQYMVGGILARLALCGVGVGVAIGTRIVGVEFFVLGLLVGIALFLGIEVISLQMWAKRSRTKELVDPNTQPEGA